MIVAIDPGGATGIALLYRSGGFLTNTVAGGFAGVSLYLSDLLEERSPDAEPIDAIVYEDFVPRPGAKSLQLDALHAIGAIKHECRKHDIPCIKQTPTQAKSFATNDKLKAVGWYTVGADHERDAARHMLVWLCNNAHVEMCYAIQKSVILNKLVSS